MYGNSRLKNSYLYEICNSEPITNEIRRLRYNLLGHILRKDPTAPSQKAMKYYFEDNDKLLKYRGKPRMTIAEMIHSEIKSAAEQNDECRHIAESLKSLTDLEKLKTFAFF